MKNPWINLPSNAPYLLPSDKNKILSFNDKASDSVKIQYHVQPEPYLGLPTAPVLLLNLNPGYSEEDIIFYDSEFTQSLWLKNILHQESPYPFYLLHEQLDPSFGGTKWWRKRLRELIEICGLQQVAKNICCIEYFPYHSRQYKPLKEVLESQLYSFHLVRNAIANNAIIVVMRSKRSWFRAVPELSAYKNLYELSNKRSTYVSKGNCPEGFPEIVKAINGQHHNRF